MKKYLTKVTLSNNQIIKFQTETNLREAKPKVINGQEMLVTENNYAFNKRHIKNIEINEAH